MNRGLTLIDLMITLIVVAILTAVAVPLAKKLQRDARIGRLQSVRGLTASTSALLHASMLERNGRPDTVGCGDDNLIANNQIVGAGTTCSERGLINTMHGYPATSLPGTPGIISATGLGSAFRPSAANLRAEGYEVLVSGVTTTIRRADATVPAKCAFTYSHPLGPLSGPVISPAVTTGC